MVRTSKSTGSEGVEDLRCCLLLSDSRVRGASTARMCRIRDESHPGGMARDGARFHHGRRCKTCKLLITGIFHVTFFGLQLSEVTQTTETKMQIRGAIVKDLRPPGTVCSSSSPLAPSPIPKLDSMWRRLCALPLSTVVPFL